MDNVWVFVGVGLVFGAAAFVHGICGFGFSLLSVSIVSFLLGAKVAIPLGLVVASVNCTYLVWIMRRDILYKEVILLCVLAMISIPLGTHYLKNMDASVAMRSLGVVVCLVALLGLVKAVHLKLFGSRYYQYIAGITSGLMGGAFNIPGPPLVLYAYHCHWPAANAKANLQFIFTVMAITTYVSFAVAGLFTREIIGWGLAYAPLVLAFTLAGAWATRHFAAAFLTRAVNVLLLVMGLALIVKG